MNTTAKAHEPTMEEILASIRRIISDDEPAATESAAAQKPAAEKSAEKPKLEAVSQPLGQDDIDAMLASFDEPTPVPKTSPENAPSSVKSEPNRIELDGDLDVFELTDDMAADAAPPPRLEPIAPPSKAPEALEPRFPAPVEQRLISQTTDEAVGAAFGSLAHTILAGNARTIDDVVREMLRPMLRAWLDDNLPPLVERLVRQEIERVARGGR